MYPMDKSEKKWANGFCGPSAFSILTGGERNHGAWNFRNKTGQDRVRGVSTDAMLATLRKCGYDVRLRKVENGDTVTSVAERADDNVWLLVIRSKKNSTHYVTVKGGKVDCNHITGEHGGPVDVAESKWADKEVTEIYNVAAKKSRDEDFAANLAEYHEWRDAYRKMERKRFADTKRVRKSIEELCAELDYEFKRELVKQGEGVVVINAKGDILGEHFDARNGDYELDALRRLYDALIDSKTEAAS